MFATYNRLGVPVWASNREVIRAARQVYRGDVRNLRIHRKARKMFYKVMLREHAQAITLYKAVMSGRF